MSKNDVTGDSLFVGGYSKQGGDNFDLIFRKNKKMADEADIANDWIERDTNIALNLARTQTKEAVASGVCLECAEKLEGDMRWCNSNCRDLWQERRKHLTK